MLPIVTAAPTTETHEQAHLRRLRASVARWERTVEYYASRCMWVEYRRALRTLELTRAALTSASEGWC